MKKVVVSLVAIAVVLSFLTVAGSAATCPAQSTSTAACPATTAAQCTSCTTSACCCCPCPVTCPVVTPCSAAACSVQTAACIPIKSVAVKAVGEGKEQHKQFEHPQLVIENMLKAKSAPTFVGNTGKNIGISVNVEAKVNQANTATTTQIAGSTTASTDIGQSSTGGTATGGSGGSAVTGGNGPTTGGDGTATGGSSMNEAAAETNALGPEQSVGDVNQVNELNINVVNNF